MKIKDLMAALSEHPPNAGVYVRHPSHDYWRTDLAGEVEDVVLLDLEWSEYHRTKRVVRGRDEDAAEDNPDVMKNQVVIDIRSGW